MSDPIIFIALFVVILAIVIAILAIKVVMKGSKAQRNAPEVTINAKVLRTFTQIKIVNDNFTSETVNSASGNEVKTYYVEFLLENKQKIKFAIKRKLFLTLHDKEEGVLIYKGTKMLSFTKTID